MGHQVLVIRNRRKVILDIYMPIIYSIGLFIAILFIGSLLLYITVTGAHRLSWELLTNFPSSNPKQAGMLPAIYGTIWTVGISTLISLPIGIATAIYLNEYSGMEKLRSFLQINLNSLAGVPSVIFGVVGLGFLSYTLGLGRSILVGSIVLAFLTLPLVTVSSLEALKAVPDDLRLGGYALGATRWEIIKSIVLPRALPMMLTGSILATSRAIGEAAPILIISGLVFIREIPTSPLDRFTVMPLQLYNWISRPQVEFRELASAGIILLLLLLILLNAATIYLRYRLSKRR
ncbi:MAG: phosphate ABC transporter permease PstA [Nitrososphaerota archaeon]